MLWCQYLWPVVIPECTYANLKIWLWEHYNCLRIATSLLRVKPWRQCFLLNSQSSKGKIVKKLTKNINCLFVLLILFIVFSVLSIISSTLPYWLYHQLSFLYAMCSKSSTCCLSEWAAVYMQEILFTLQRLKMFLHHHDLSYLQCLSIVMNRMFV